MCRKKMIIFYKQVFLFGIFVSVIETALSDEWSICSRTCGMGVEERIVPCQNAGCNGTQKEYRVCNVMTCPDNGNNPYQWVVGNDFTSCSQTCGRGTQRSEIYCQQVQTQMRVPYSQCNGLSMEALEPVIQFCDQPPCPSEWQVSDWSPCSKSCGGGHKRRNAICAHMYRLELAPVPTPRECDNITKPATQQTCNTHPCHNHWDSGQWSMCSSGCGNGIQRRNITCMDVHRRKIHKHNCSLLMKPAVERSCTEHSCTYKWITSDWSNCSMKCGIGIQIRNVNCTEDGRIVEDRICFENSEYVKPVEQRNCSGVHCSGKWFVQEWNTTCEAPNCYAKGNQYRSVYCIHDREISNDDDQIECDPSTMPSYVRSCYKTSGCNPKWVTSPWSECNEDCESRRLLECKMGNARVHDNRCLDVKPVSFRMCGPECPYLVCLKEFCHLDNLGICEKKCCEYSVTVIPEYLGPLLRYRLVEKPCCEQCKSKS
ncbi:thrombospondin type-1 domain-containing protein 4-like [Dysidea avara]|uniref:thrombospondin type-1 domain-containing protein 4-like n=1 Tax=Dysidea avara TaxID=196820 RepID=UPI00331AC25D